VGPLCSVSTGSTHTVLFCDASTTDKYFELWSPRLEEHAAFPDRSSILWAQVLAPGELSVRIWERGVGETLACGTGACAVAVAAMKLGLSEGEAARVRSKGGVLQIGWDHRTEGEQATIWKEGRRGWFTKGDFRSCLASTCATNDKKPTRDTRWLFAVRLGFSGRACRRASIRCCA
jgi:diaminopimelate epimerase